MDRIISFGYWVRRRRKTLDFTQAELANRVGCSLSLLRKIERDERMPSHQVADLLARHLAIDPASYPDFIQMARGKYVDQAAALPGMNSPPPANLTSEYTNRNHPATFVGRDKELCFLEEQLRETQAGRGSVVFIAGEAGRGKTSLVRAFVQKAQAAYPQVIITQGTCNVYSGAGDPFLPFRDIFNMLTGNFEENRPGNAITQLHMARLLTFLPSVVSAILTRGPHLVDTFVPGAVLESRLNQAAAQSDHLVALLPELRNLRKRAESAGNRIELQRDYLFTEIWAVLKSLSLEQPLVLILDDLHWADLSSIALLNYLVRQVENHPILIICCYRTEDLFTTANSGDIEQHRQYPLAPILDECKLRYGEIFINLDRSDAGEQQAFVDALLDIELNRFSQSFRQHLLKLTEANPLFVIELIRDLQERGSIDKDSGGAWVEGHNLSWAFIPARIEAVIEHRLHGLPAGLRETLEIASVEGEVFTAEVVAAVQKVEAKTLVRRLGAELDRQHWMVKESNSSVVGNQRLCVYHFRHNLFQKYLYDNLSEAERIYTHEAVGDALEAIYRDDSASRAEHALQIAVHYEKAKLPEKAAVFWGLAGDWADQLYAYEEEIGHLARALELLENLPGKPQVDQKVVELTISLGRAQWKTGRVAEALTMLRQAISIAHKLGSAQALAGAVLAYEDPRWRLNLSAHLIQPLMEEALQAMGTTENALSVRLRVAYIRLLFGTGSSQQLVSMTEDTVTMARQVQSWDALIDALRVLSLLHRRPEDILKGLEFVSEAIEIARRTGDDQRLIDCIAVRTYDLAELGDFPAFERDIQEHARLVTALRQPFYSHVGAVFQVWLAILRGSFDLAEKLANDVWILSQQMGIEHVDGIYGMLMFAIRREQDRLSEIAPVVRAFVASNPVSAAWRPGLALVYADLGMEKECRGVFEELAAGDFNTIPEDSLWVTCLVYLAEVCAYLGDEARAAILYRLLLPYQNQVVIAGGAVMCYGAAARYLGILATVLADWEAAGRHFRMALKINRQFQAPTWIAHTLVDLSKMLLLQSRAQNGQEAFEWLDQASATAQELGMKKLTKSIAALRAEI